MHGQTLPFNLTYEDKKLINPIDTQSLPFDFYGVHNLWTRIKCK